VAYDDLLIGVSAPVLSPLTTATSGGTLAAATYFYVVTATTAVGETTGSDERSVATTGAASTVTLAWTAVPGATGYKVYRSTSAGTEVLIATVGVVLTYTDTGAAAGATTVPTTNSTVVSLKTLGHIVSFDGIFSDGPLRGENVVYPGVAGATHMPKVRGAYVFTVPMVILGDWGDVNAALNSLRTLLDSSAAPLAMTRHRTVGAGTSVQTAAGDYLDGLEPNLIGMSAGRVAINLVNLDGAWT
jgi:hypothetical protein